MSIVFDSECMLETTLQVDKSYAGFLCQFTPIKIHCKSWLKAQKEPCHCMDSVKKLQKLQTLWENKNICT